MIKDNTRHTAAHFIPKRMKIPPPHHPVFSLFLKWNNRSEQCCCGLFNNNLISLI